MNELTIVMYHYVREISNSRFPRIKGLEIDGFRRQLDYLSKHYVFITVEEIFEYYSKGLQIPAKACWLTFDDGYKDHFTYVLPELSRRGIEGSFFVPSKPVLKDIVLDVHAIQHILASASNEEDLLSEFASVCESDGISRDLLDGMWKEHDVASRFDSAGVAYFKRMLQHVLPLPVRSRVLSRLLEKFVRLDEAELSDQLYLTPAETKVLKQSGMVVGGHTHSHPWLDKLSTTAKRSELDASRAFLQSVGVDENRWTMAYPYGAYDAEIIGILEAGGCELAVTTKPEIARLDSNKLALARLDTNDFPQ